MGTPVNRVILLAAFAALLAFVGTLVAAPSPFDDAQFGSAVRSAAVRGAWDEVGRLARRGLRRDPSSQEACLFWGLAEERLGHPRGAAVAWERLKRLTRDSMDRGSSRLDQFNYLGWALHGLGDKAGAARAWGEAARRVRGAPASYNAACALAVAGERESALAVWVEFSERGTDLGTLEWASVDPDLDSIRSDPRFAEGLARLRQRAEAQTRI